MEASLLFSVVSLSKRLAGQPVFVSAFCVLYAFVSVDQLAVVLGQVGSRVDDWPMHGICGVTSRELPTLFAYSGECAPSHGFVPGATVCTVLGWTVQEFVVCVEQVPSLAHAVQPPIWTTLTLLPDVPMFEPPVSDSVPSTFSWLPV